MPDLDKSKIFSNPTLGEAANGKFLDAEQAQLDENRNAEREGREPRKVAPNPKWPGTNTNIPNSRHNDFHFEGEESPNKDSSSDEANPPPVDGPQAPQSSDNDNPEDDTDNFLLDLDNETDNDAT